MNKNQFWEIIDDFNQSSPDEDRDTRLEKLIERLRQLPAEEIMSWNGILHEYSDAAYRNDLWAASEAVGAHATDDGFMYFRSWLISRGKEVYMSVIRNPDSLADVPFQDGEDLNFERFGYSGTEAYERKFGFTSWNMPQEHWNKLIDHVLDPQIVAEIQAELPRRKDITKNWTLFMLPDLFPRITKFREPKDIAGLLGDKDVLSGYVYKGERCDEYVFHGSPENIANFIGSHLDADNIVVTTAFDSLVLNTIGPFIDRCPDQKLLEKIKETLIPIQQGEARPQPFLCPTYEEFEECVDEMETGDMDFEM